MKAKLIKVGKHYDLYFRIAEENLIIGFASTDNTYEKKLSIKNSKEIELQNPNKKMWDVNVDINKLYGYELPKLDADGCLILKTFKSE